MRRPARSVILVFLLAYAGLSAVPAWLKVANAKHGRDYATYHYAAAEAFDGGDPYDTKALDKRAIKDRTRKSVHPYFYPPPFLFFMAWSPEFSLAVSAKLWFSLNQVLLLLCLSVFRAWFRAPWAVLGILLLTFTPITDSAKMGQANLLVLLTAVTGLWLRSGALVGVAAMSKMSPAIYLFAWLARQKYRPILSSIFVAIGSSLLALLFIDFDTQRRFYEEVLPGFSTGQYHGLKVRIGLPANHSIPDLLNQYWPGPTKYALAPMAATTSKIISGTLLVVLMWCARQPTDRLGAAGLFGAFTVLMLVTPVYAYEHHLVMALFPAAVVWTALFDGRLGRWGWCLGLPAYFFTAWPLFWLRPLQKVFPDMHWLLQESKFFGLIMLGVLCVLTARNASVGR